MRNNSQSSQRGFKAFGLWGKCWVILLGMLWGALALAKETTQSLPEWVSEPQKTFSSSRYWVGVGQARSLSEAQDKARGEVAKILQTNIKVNNQYSTEVEQNSEKNKGAEEVKTKGLQSVLVESDVMLENVRIMKSYQDVQTGNFYVLAALDKDLAIDKLTDDLKAVQLKMDERVQEAFLADKNHLRLPALFAWIETQSLIQERERLSRWIKSLGGEVESLGDLVKQARQSVSRLKSQVRLAVSVDGDKSAALEKVAQSFLAKNGIKITKNASEADGVFEIQVAVDDLIAKDRMFIQTASLDLRLESAALESFNIDAAQVPLAIEGCHVNVRKVASDRQVVARDTSRAVEQVISQFLESVVLNKPMKGCV